MEEAEEVLQSMYCAEGEKVTRDSSGVHLDVKCMLGDAQATAVVVTATKRPGIDVSMDDMRAVHVDVAVSCAALQRGAVDALRKEFAAQCSTIQEEDAEQGIAEYLLALLAWLGEQPVWNSLGSRDETKYGQGPESAGRVPDAASNITLQRQWIWFIGFYTRSIIKEFVACGEQHGLTGFLMPGKPAVACAEGPAEDIAAFIKEVRTSVFATVPRASRKMTMALCEEDITREWKQYEEAPFGHKTDGHNRKDMADLKELLRYLEDHHCGHAFDALDLTGTGA